MSENFPALHFHFHIKIIIKFLITSREWWGCIIVCISVISKSWSHFTNQWFQSCLHFKHSVPVFLLHVIDRFIIFFHAVMVYQLPPHNYYVHFACRDFMCRFFAYGEFVSFMYFIVLCLYYGTIDLQYTYRWQTRIVNDVQLGTRCQFCITGIEFPWCSLYRGSTVQHLYCTTLVFCDRWRFVKVKRANSASPAKSIPS